MRQPSKIGGGSIASRLLLLVTLPGIALAILGIQRVNDEREEATAARRVVDRAELQSSIADVVGPARLEQIALEGLARVDELGVPREVVVELSGVDFETIYEPNRVALDDALDGLLRDHGSLILGDGRPLAQRLRELTGELDAQRELVGRARATPPAIRDVFDRIDDALSDALAADGSMSDERMRSSMSRAPERARLQALGDVVAAAGHRGTALLDGLIRPSRANSFELIAASERLETTIGIYAAQLTAEQLEHFAEVDAERAPIATDVLVVDPDRQPLSESTLSPENIERTATALLQQIDYLDALEAYSGETNARAVRSLETLARDAEASMRRTLAGIVAVTVSTIALLAAVGWSVLRPLRRLTRRARSVSRGDLHAPPVPVSGPRDVRTLTDSMNQMLATLQNVDRQITELADGTRSSLQTPPPGAIGVSLRRSFDLLQGTTAQLHASEELASAIVAQAADAIWTIDAEGRIRSANRASVELLGVDAGAQISMPIGSYLTTLDGESGLVHDDRSVVRCLVTNSAIEGGAEPLTVVIAHDLTERVRFEERLEYQASHDALTRLPNRFALLEHISNSPVGESLAILFVDLDGFKQVNDVQGHLVGDNVLSEVAARLSSVIDGSDFVGRLGGDEFVVILHDVDGIGDAVARGRDLIAQIELPPYGDDTAMFTLSASVGVAVYEAGLGPAGLSPLDAIRQADSAVYLAKERGRGRVEVFDLDLQDAIVRGADLEMALRSALTNGELEVHLQPVMDLSNGRFTSAEALIRWNRPGVGMVSPAEFIPIAERSSLILSIDRWVVGQACDLLARWRSLDAGSTTRIAVNISGRHLVDGSLVTDIDAALARSGADPTLLEIELTETHILGDLERATAILDDIRGRGITVAIDDFGTGYSSMAYLQRLPIDTLKIDRSFISMMSGDSHFDSTVLDALLCERSGKPVIGDHRKPTRGRCSGRRVVRLAGVSAGGVGGRDFEAVVFA